jgi:hypothetical protein
MPTHPLVNKATAVTAAMHESEREVAAMDGEKVSATD